jgi:AraC-like DNA-binding protein
MNHALTLYTIFQSLLFAIVLLLARKPENRYLTIYFIYLFFLDLSLLVTSGYWGNSLPQNEFMETIHELIVLCRPAIVFYFLYSLLEKSAPKPLSLLWLLPLLNLVYHYTCKFLGTDLYTLSFYKNWYLSFSLYTKILFISLLIWQLTVFKKAIAENNVSKKATSLLKLYWGNYFIYFNLILLITSLVYNALTLANGRIYTSNSSFFIYSEYGHNIIYQIFTAFFLFVFGYLALRNPSVFNTITETAHLENRLIEIVLPEEEKSFQKKIELTDEQTIRYTHLLNKLMENDKIYLDPELSLSKLASLSGIPSRLLSQFIQLAFQKKYTEYINVYRIEHAQKLLTQPNSSRSIMYSVAFDSGFNSESSFYTLFKQQTGVTPKQYRDKFKPEP